MIYIPVSSTTMVPQFGFGGAGVSLSSYVTSGSFNKIYGFTVTYST
jgi:hypothetical protein